MRFTYQEAYDKIIDAYYKDQIKPMNSQFCFCGTLHEGPDWRYGKLQKGEYTPFEFSKMEAALFDGILNEYGLSWNADPEKHYVVFASMNTLHIADLLRGPSEEALFCGMSKALEVLKEIHRGRGEDVDNLGVSFQKRKQIAIL